MKYLFPLTASLHPEVQGLDIKFLLHFLLPWSPGFIGSMGGEVKNLNPIPFSGTIN